MSDENPRIDLDFNVHWCARHLEPFREGWPAGAGVAMVKLLEATLADDRIAAAAPKDANGLAKTDSLNAVLREHSPLCCFIAAAALADVYDAAGQSAAAHRLRELA